jgi:hypothetical protein
MLPFIIGGHESVILQKPASSSQPHGLPPSDRGTVQVGDVVLAWADGCRYVVHRIIAIDGDAVTLMGDGNLAGVEHCVVSDIKALVTHVVGADGKPHDLYCRWRRMAAKIWWYLRPVRKYLLAIYRKMKR